MAIDAFALILLMLALGTLFARLKVLPENTPDVLNRLVLYLCLPAAILTYVPRLHLDSSLIGLILTPWLLMLASLLLIWLAHRWLNFRRDQYAVLLLCVCLGNTSFIGYPMVRALLGETALPYAVVYDQFGTFIMLSTFGIYILNKYGADTSPTLKQILLRMLKFPPFIALLFALSLMPQTPPTWIATPLKSLSDTMLPLSILSVGFSIRLRLTTHEARPLAVGLTLKLLLLPSLAIPLSYAFSFTGESLQANILESAMPTMITAAALAISYQLAPQLAAALVGYGILLSLITLPAWAYIAHLLS